MHGPLSAQPAKGTQKIRDIIEAVSRSEKTLIDDNNEVRYFIHFDAVSVARVNISGAWASPCHAMGSSHGVLNGTEVNGKPKLVHSNEVKSPAFVQVK